MHLPCIYSVEIAHWTTTVHVRSAGARAPEDVLPAARARARLIYARILRLAESGKQV
jgi:hypothetical protein